MPTDRFTCVWERTHVCRGCAYQNTKVIERLFVVKGREEEYRRKMWVSKVQPTLFDYSNEEGETA